MESVFKTKDLYVSAYLFSQGLKPINVERKNNQVIFAFPECNALVQGFFSGKNSVVAIDYVSSIKQAKQIIYGVQ